MFLGNRLGLGRVRPLGFNPLTIDGLSLYLNKKIDVTSATIGQPVSSWVDQSVNAYDFIQGTGISQPINQTNYIEFDNSNDSLFKNISNPYSGDSSGILFFSGRFDNTGNNRVFSSADKATELTLISFEVDSSGYVRINTIINTVRSTNTITNGDYYYGYIKSTGTAWEISLNGVVETLVVAAGTNNGDWFADIPNRDNLSVGSVQRLSTVYSPAKVNKIIYSNANLSSDEIDDINTFMSVESN